MSEIKNEEDRVHWEERYNNSLVEELPWFYPELDEDIADAIKELNVIGGKVLDLGAGPGTQSIELARRGFDVTGIDIAEAAVREARIRAEREGVNVTFKRDDILNTRLNGRFDLIIDRGCFHALSNNRFKDYADTINSLLKEEGWLFLKCFSHKERREEGPPNRLSEDDIQKVFNATFFIRTIRESHFAPQKGKTPPLALFCMLQKSKQL